MQLAEVPNPCRVSKPEIFLSPQKYLESDHGRIKAMAVSLELDNPAETAERIFERVNLTVRYSGYAGNERGALFALEKGQGDCTEFMYLFAALCRARRIPARCMAGFVIQNNTLLKPAGFHNWADVYLGKTWRTADPMNRVFLNGADFYVAFRIITDDPDWVQSKKVAKLSDDIDAGV